MEKTSFTNTIGDGTTRLFDNSKISNEYDMGFGTCCSDLIGIIQKMVTKFQGANLDMKDSPEYDATLLAWAEVQSLLFLWLLEIEKKYPGAFSEMEDNFGIA